MEYKLTVSTELNGGPAELAMEAIKIFEEDSEARRILSHRTGMTPQNVLYLLQLLSDNKKLNMVTFMSIVDVYFDIMEHRANKVMSKLSDDDIKRIVEGILNE